MGDMAGWGGLTQLSAAGPLRTGQLLVVTMALRRIKARVIEPLRREKEVGRIRGRPITVAIDYDWPAEVVPEPLVRVLAMGEGREYSAALSATSGPSLP